MSHDLKIRKKNRNEKAALLRATDPEGSPASELRTTSSSSAVATPSQVEQLLQAATDIEIEDPEGSPASELRKSLLQ